MRLSQKNEDLLKTAMAAQDKDMQIHNISKQIEEFEAGMTTQINTGYLDIIDKCVTLEEMKKGLRMLLNTNRGLRTEADELLLRYSAVEEEETMMRKAEERVEEIRMNLLNISRFIEKALLLDKQIAELAKGENGDAAFHVSESLLAMEERKDELKKYVFYRDISLCYKDRFERTAKLICDRIEKWITNMDLIGIGRSIELESTPGLFDSRVRFRQSLFSSDFLQLSYVARKIKIDRSIVKIFENGCLQAITKLKSSQEHNNNAIPAFISLLMLSDSFRRVFPGSRSLHEEIFSLLENARPGNILEVVQLRRAAGILHIESEAIDGYIETATFAYFERSFTGTDDFFENLQEFIEESTTYLRNLGDQGDELCELLARRVDDLLLEKVGEFTGTDKEFIATQEQAEDKIHMLITRIPGLSGFQFMVEEKMNEKNEEIIAKSYEEIANKIRESKEMRDSVEIILSLKNFMSEKCRNELVLRLARNSKDLLNHTNQDDLSLFIDTIRRNFNVSL